MFGDTVPFGFSIDDYDKKDPIYEAFHKRYSWHSDGLVRGARRVKHVKEMRADRPPNPVVKFIERHQCRHGW